MIGGHVLSVAEAVALSLLVVLALGGFIRGMGARGSLFDGEGEDE